MTIREAIERADALRPNAVPFSEKAFWLATLDARAEREIFALHEPPAGKARPVTVLSDGAAALLIPPPYDGAYLYWLTANIDYVNRDIAGYNNAIALFNAEYTAFWRWYNRTRTPKTERLRFFRGRGVAKGGGAPCDIRP